MKWVESMRKLRKDNGQGMVEFALVLPILLLVMFGIIEFGRLLFTYSMVSAASREGARYGAAAEYFGSDMYRYNDCDEIRAAATRIGRFAGVTNSDIDISYDRGPYETPYATVCPPPTPTEENDTRVKLGDRIIVTVSTNFEPIIPIVNVPAIPFSSTTRRTIIKGVRVDPLGADG